MTLTFAEAVKETHQGIPALRVGGFAPLTTIDFPDELAAVVFTQGCSLRCQYCQNSHLIPARSESNLAWNDIQAFLQKRIGLLDAVIFSGGEPTLQKGLANAIHDVKSLGFKVGIHTAGTVPERLEEIIADLDWVGFDIKTLPEEYPLITGTNQGNKGWQSLEMLLASGVPYEVRTTVHWQLLPPEKLLHLAKRLQEKGVQQYALQECRTGNCLNPKLPPSILDKTEQQKLYKQLEACFPHFEVRY